MKMIYFPIVKLASIVCLILFCVTYLTSCATTTALKPTEARYEKGKGKLITNDGYEFAYKFYPSNQRGPSVIYVAGMGGKVATGQGKGGYVLASRLKKANFNFIGFDRPGHEAPLTKRERINNVRNRSKSRSPMFPAIDGKESGAENIVRNEILSIIEFLERAPSHDPEKGIYLIGGSFGSWISLVTVSSFPDKIKGVVFLSPAIIPEMVSADKQARARKLNISNYFQSLIQSFGQRPALAIGSKNDIIDPDAIFFKDGSAWHGAQLLRKEMGPNVDVMEVSSSLHANKLVEGNREVKERIVQWLTANAYVN